MTIREDIYRPRHLSHSSVSTYAQCGEKWRLTRGHHVPDSTWFATLAGRALHIMTEDADRAYAKGIAYADFVPTMRPFSAYFEDELSGEKGEVKASGRVLEKIGPTGGPNKKDKDWWLHFGPGYFRDYIKWRQETMWDIPLFPDGRVGIEMEFEVELAGEKVVGFIDRLFLVDGKLAVIDLKAGKRPDGALQLATYWAALLKDGLEADWGAFWVFYRGRSEHLSDPTLFKDWSLDRLENMFASARRGIEAGVFLPNVSSLCKGCTVRDWCWAVADATASMEWPKYRKLPITPKIIDQPLDSEPVEVVETTVEEEKED